MSNYVAVNLTTPASVAAGAAIDVSPRSPIRMGLSGTFSATVSLEWSPDSSGSVWNVLGALTAPGIRTLAAGRARRIRANTTAFSSGVPVVDAMHDLAFDRYVIERTFQEDTLAIPTSVEAGAALTIEEGEQCMLSLSGTFAATVQLQVSLSNAGSDWHDWGEALTAAGEVRVPRGTAARVRANTTAFTSGTPVGKVLSGFAAEDVVEDSNRTDCQTQTGRFLDNDQTPETVTSGACSVVKRTTLLSITGIQALTLADGLYIGQVKDFVVVVAAGNTIGTLTPANMTGGTTHVFDTLNQVLSMMWDGAGWQIFAQSRSETNGLFAEDLGAPDVADDNRFLISVVMQATAYTLDETTLPADNPPRNVIVTHTTDTTTDTLGDAVIVGTDVNDAVITETLTVNADGTVIGTKAFKTITSVTTASWVQGGGVSDLLEVGFDTLLGLSVTLANADQVWMATLDGLARLGAIAVNATLVEENTISLSGGTYDSTKLAKAILRRA